MIKKFYDFKLNEDLEFKMIPTQYELIKISALFLPNSLDTIYRFLTKNGNSYDLYFSLTNENNHLLSNDNFIYDYTKSEIPTIFFSLTERGLDPINFDDLTNKGEKFEVMSKIIWLINEYDISNNFKIYSVGEVGNDKYRFYSYYLYNMPQFKIVEGASDNYNGKKCYYLIK